MFEEVILWTKIGRNLKLIYKIFKNFAKISLISVARFSETDLKKDTTSKDSCF